MNTLSSRQSVQATLCLIQNMKKLKTYISQSLGYAFLIISSDMAVPHSTKIIASTILTILLTSRKKSSLSGSIPERLHTVLIYSTVLFSFGGAHLYIILCMERKLCLRI